MTGGKKQRHRPRNCKLNTMSVTPAAAGGQSRQLWLLALGAAAAAVTAAHHAAFWAPLVLLALAVVAAGSLCGSSSGLSPTQPPAAALQQVIRSRRSVYPKDMTGDNSSITHDKLEAMLEAARWAPTHKLTEPWRFVVLEGSAKAQFEALTIKCCRELLPPDKAEATVAKLLKKQQTTWPKVHCYIAICMQRHADAVPEWEEVAACACAVQNMWLTAAALRVGGYWSSWQPAARDAPVMAQLLGLDGAAGDRCLGVFVVGAPDPERVAALRPRRAPLADKVTWLSDDAFLNLN